MSRELQNLQSSINYDKMMVTLGREEQQVVINEDAFLERLDAWVLQTKGLR